MAQHIKMGHVMPIKTANKANTLVNRMVVRIFSLESKPIAKDPARWKANTAAATEV